MVLSELCGVATLHCSFCLIGIIEEKDNSEEIEKTFAAKLYSWIPFKSCFERKKKASVGDPGSAIWERLLS